MENDNKEKKKIDTDDDTGDEATASAIDEYENDGGDDDEEGEVDDDNLNKYCYNIQICGNIYTIDFKNMIQYPQTMPYRKRKICRAKGIPSKGTAGLLKHKRNHRTRPY